MSDDRMDMLITWLRYIDTLTLAELEQVKIRLALREQHLRGEVTLL